MLFTVSEPHPLKSPESKDRVGSTNYPFLVGTCDFNHRCSIQLESSFEFFLLKVHTTVMVLLSASQYIIREAHGHRGNTKILII